MLNILAITHLVKKKMNLLLPEFLLSIDVVTVCTAQLLQHLF